MVKAYRQFRDKRNAEMLEKADSPQEQLRTRYQAMREQVQQGGVRGKMAQNRINAHAGFDRLRGKVGEWWTGQPSPLLEAMDKEGLPDRMPWHMPSR